MNALILKKHGIVIKIVDTKIFAQESLFDISANKETSKWVNVSNWSTKKLYKWLGY